MKNAYLGILCREVDSDGYNYYLGMLRQGTRTKVEILGRLRYSGEGRHKSVRVRGLFFPLLAHTSYRIPVVGYLSRLITGLIQFPTIIRDFQLLDVHTQNQFLELKDYLNRITGSVHSKFDEIIAYQSSLEDLRDSKADRLEFQASLEELRDSKADRVEIQSSLEDLRDSKADRVELQSSIEELRDSKADREELQSSLEELRDSKADRVELQSSLEHLRESKADRADFEKSAEKAVNQAGHL